MTNNSSNSPSVEFQKLIIGIAFGCICICIIILVIYNSPYIAVSYSLKLDGELIFSDGKVALEIASDDFTTLKSIFLYGINNISETKIAASILTSGTREKLIESNAITLSNPIINSQVRNDDPSLYEFSLSIDNITTGIYRGWLFITDSAGSSNVPISVSTMPKITESLIIVIIGVLIAIISRESLKLYALSESISKRNRLAGEINSLSINKTKQRLTETESLKLQLDQINLFNIQQKIVSLENRLDTPTQKLKLLSIDIGTVIIGLIVSLIALINDNFINSIVSFNVENVLILLGTGLGIGILIRIAEKDP
jgi:hypothetical protein